MPDAQLMPYTKNGEHLIAGVSSGAKMVTSSEYHGVREGIMKMRTSDPATASLYDKYLTDVVQNKKDWPAGDMQKLEAGMAKNNVSLNNLTNEVSRDLKVNGYSASYRPAVMVDVQGRPMHPEVVADNLKGRGINPEGSIPRSVEPGKVAGGIKLGAADAVTFSKEVAAEGNVRGFKESEGLFSKTLAKEVVGEAAHKAHSFGLAGKAAGAVMAGGAVALSGNASASEIGKEAINGAAPGLGTLALGEGPKEGVLCEAFGQATGAIAGFAAGIFASPVVTPVGGVVVGMATEAVVTPGATAACKKLTM